MITVISNPNCDRCRIAKKRLELAKVPFRAEMLSSFSTEDQMFYIALAREHGQQKFPIIINEDNEILDLEGVLTDVRQNRQNS